MAQRQQQQQQPISQTPAAADPFSSSYHLSPRTDTNVQAPAPPPKSPRTAQRSREASAATSIGAAEAGEPTPNGIPNHAHGLSNDRSPNPPPTAVGSQSQRPAPQRQDMLEQEERSAAAVPSSDELKRQPTWAKGIDFDTSNFALDFDQFSSPGLPASASPSGGPSPAQYPTASTGSARRDGPSALTDDRPSDSWQDDRRAQNRGDGSAGRKTPGASSSSTGKGRDGREKTRSREKDREQELLSSGESRSLRRRALPIL